MPNLHPVLTSFPLSLITLVVLFEIYQVLFRSEKFNPAVQVILLVALLFSVAAFFSGYTAREMAGELNSEVGERVSTHHQFGRLLLFAIFPCLGLQFAAQRAKHGKQAFRLVYFTFLILTLGLVIYTGYLGGKLVFDDGVGVGPSLSGSK